MACMVGEKYTKKELKLMQSVADEIFKQLLDLGRYYQNNKKKKNEYQKKYNKNHPEIIKLRNDTREYIRKNQLEYWGNCLDCGNYTKREIHHTTPTIKGFIFICKDCHYKRHNKVRRK